MYNHTAGGLAMLCEALQCGYGLLADLRPAELEWLQPHHAAQVQLPGAARALQKVIGNPSVRLGAVAALALVAVWGYQASGSASGADLTNALEVRPVTMFHL